MSKAIPVLTVIGFLLQFLFIKVEHEEKYLPADFEVVEKKMYE